MSIHKISNVSAKARGTQNENNVLRLLNELVAKQRLKGIETKVKLARTGYSERQFTVPIVVTDLHDNKILIFPTTTNHDLIKKLFYIAGEVREYTELGARSIAAIAVMPEEDESYAERDLQGLYAYQDDLKALEGCEGYMGLTHIFKPSQFEEFLEALDAKYENTYLYNEEGESMTVLRADDERFVEGDEELAFATPFKDEALPIAPPPTVVPESVQQMNTFLEGGSLSGAGYSNRGKAFEVALTDALNAPGILARYQTHQPLFANQAKMSQWVGKLLDSLSGFCKDGQEIDWSRATSLKAVLNDGIRPMGGYYKTDVYVEVGMGPTPLRVNFSLKVSPSKSVSCHEGNATQLNNHLYPNAPQTALEMGMCQAFDAFQAAGNWQKVDWDANPLSSEDFVDEYKRRYDDFYLYFVQGVHAQDPHTIEDRIDFILWLNPASGEFHVHNAMLFREYYRPIVGEKARSFTPPFSFTYPSKKRGKKIQVKMPLEM